jgi:hypothetical protein
MLKVKAAKVEMSAPKIPAMENEPRNLTIGTLIRVAHALGSKVQESENRKSKLGKSRLKQGRGRNGLGQVKTPTLTKQGWGTRADTWGFLSTDSRLHYYLIRDTL